MRLSSVTDREGRPVRVTGRDPNRFPVPVSDVLAPGASSVTRVIVSGTEPLLVSVGADGGRTIATANS